MSTKKEGTERMAEGDIIPEECIKDAKDFIEQLHENVEYYKSLVGWNSITADEEADKFCAYISLLRYKDHPHALFVLYERQLEIDEEFGERNVQNVVEFIKYRTKRYYEVLKENGYIDE